MRSDEKAATVRISTALEAKIQALRSSFSDKEQNVAAFLLEDPKEFISLSISAIASRCGVSETVIIRLYRKLGFAGFHEFKIAIAGSLTEDNREAMGDLGTGDDVETIKRKVFGITRQALEDSLASVSAADLVRARDAILKARRVVVAAFGGSASVGLDLVHKLLKLGIIATLQTDSHMQIMSAMVMGEGDLLIGITHSGNTRDVVEALQQARAKGATTMVLTGFPFSAAAKAADIPLYSICRETKYQTDSMTSRIVQLALVDALYVAITFANKEQALAHIHETSVAAAKKKL